MANEVVKVTEVTNVITASLNDGSYNLLAGGTIGGNLQLGGTLTVGENDLGHDVKFFGATSGKYLQWDESADKLIIAGDLDVTGTTTSFNSTVVTIDDPVFTIGGDTAPSSDDNKDRGIEFRYHDGSTPRVGFFGYDDSESAFTFLTSATNTSEVFSGTLGNVKVNRVLLEDGSASEPSLTFSNDTDLGIYRASSDNLVFSAQGNERFRVSVFGVETNYQVKSKNGTAASPSFAFNGDSTTGMFRAASDSIGFSCNGTEAARFDASGHFAIGETTPSAYDGDADDLIVKTGGNTGISIRTSSTGKGSIFFADGISGSERYQGKIQYFHSDNSLRFATSATEAARFDSSGDFIINDSNEIKNNTSHLRFSTGSQDNNNIVFKPNGTLQMTLTDTGLLGIGGTPNVKLHVSNGTSGFSGSYNARTTAIIESDNSAGTALSILSPSSGNCAIYFGDNTEEYSGQIGYTHNGDVMKFLTSATERMSLNSTGLGIGGTPTQKLSVIGGHIELDDNRHIQWGGSNNRITGNDASDFIRFFTAGNEAARFDASGNLGIGTSSPSAKLDIAAGWIELDTAYGIRWGGTANTIWGSGGNNYIKIETNGAERLRVDGQGDVGIGVTDPSEKLSVAGNVRIEGDNRELYFSGNQAKFRTSSASSDVIFETGTTELLRLDGSDSSINVPDTIKLRIGSSNDLDIYHSGTNSLIQNNTGAFFILNQDAEQDIIFKTVHIGDSIELMRLDGSASTIHIPNDIQLRLGGGSDIRIVSESSQNVFTFYNHDTLFRTLTDDIDIIFKTTAGGTTSEILRLDGSASSINIPDNVKLKLGGGDDLKIFHDGSNSYIQDDSGTGDLIVNTNAFRLKTANNAESMITAFEDGAVNIMHNDITRLSTTSSGININGGITFDSTFTEIIRTPNSLRINIDNDGNQTDRIFIVSANSGMDELFRVQEDGKVGIGGVPSAPLDIISSATGGTTIELDNTSTGGRNWTLYSSGSGNSFGAGSFALYDADAASIRFLINSFGNVGIGTTSPNALLNVQSDSNPTILINAVTGNSVNSGKLAFAETDGGAHQAFIKYDGSANRLEIGTADVAQALVVNRTDGNVGIGTTSPDFALDVAGDIGIDDKIYHNGDHNTYIGFTGADTISFRTGGTDVITLDSSGNVGIGNTSASAKLDIRQNSGVAIRCEDSTGAYFTVDQSGNVLMSGASPVLNCHSSNGTSGIRINVTGLDDDTDTLFRVQDNGTNRIRVEKDGDTLITGDLVVEGGLTIQGTTTTIDTANLTVEDKNIIIGNVSSPSDTTADGGGITLKGASDYTIAWSNSTDYWTFNQGIEIDVGSANAKGIKIGNDSYDASIIPTSLGGVAISSSDPFLFYLNGAIRATFTTDGKLNLPDSGEITLGTGNDLKLYHDASDSYILNQTGSLVIRNTHDDGSIYFQSDDGSGGVATYLKVDGSTANTIFSKPIQVGVDDTGYDVTFFGATSGAYMLWDESDDALRLADNTFLQCGNGADLQLWHDGSNSTILNYTGNLTIKNAADDSDIIFECDDGSGGTETYFYLDGSFNTAGNPFTIFPDNSRIAVGNSADLSLFHNGTNSNIENITGNLNIINYADDKDIAFQCDDGSGGVETYFLCDGSASSGFPIIRFPDNSMITLGTDNDLYFRHDGTNTYLENNTGDFYIRANANDKDIIFQSDNGAGGVETYFRLDGSASSGDPVTEFPDNSKLSLGASQHGITLYHDGTDSFITNAIGDLTITNFNNDKDIIFQSDDGSGGTETYFFLDGSTGGTSPYTVFPDDSRLAFGNAGDNTFMHLLHNGNDSYIENMYGHLYITNYADDKDIIFKSDDGSGGVTEYFRVDGGAENTIFSKNTSHGDDVYAKFGNAADMQIVHSGNNNIIKAIVGDLIIENAADDKDIIFKSDDGSGGTTDYFRLDGGENKSIFSANVQAQDNVRIYAGSSGDLAIFHDGSSSIISNNTGHLDFKNTANDADVRFYSDDGSGGEAEYFRLDGGDSINVFSKNVKLTDSVQLNLGGGNDFQLYHDGSNSYVTNATGDMYFINSADDKDIIFMSDDGSGGFETYFFLDGSASSGNPFTIFPDNSILQFGTDQDLYIYSDGGSNSYIKNSNGHLQLIQYATDKDIVFQCDDGSGGVAQYIRIDGSAELTQFDRDTKYADTRKAVFGNDGDLEIYHNISGDTVIDNFNGDLYISNKADDKDIVFRCDDGSGGYETYFFLDGSASSGNPITNFPDNSFLSFGSSHDFSIYHDSTNTYIANSTNDLYIQNNADNADIIFRSDDGSGGVTDYLRLDGSDSIMKAHKKLRFLDNVKGTFGNADDLQIYHDGTHSYIENNTGVLYIKNNADDQRIRFVADDGAGGTTSYFNLNSGQATHNGTNTTMLMTSWGDNSRVTFGNGIDFQLWHDSTNSRIYSQTGDLIIEQAANDKDIIFQCDDGSGGMETYFFLDGSKSTGNPYTIFPNSSFLGFGADGNLLINHGGSSGSASIQNNGGDLNITQNTNDGDVTFFNDDGSGSVAMYLSLDGGREIVRHHRGVEYNVQSPNNADYTVGSHDYCIIMHSLTQSRTVTIPTAQRNTGRVLIIKERDGYASTYNVVIDPEGSTTIDGNANYTISTNKEAVTLISDGSNWFIIGKS